MTALKLLLWAGLAAAQLPASCPSYTAYSTDLHGPFTGGRYNLSYQRPDPSCRTTSFAEVESTISDMQAVIKDPDLYRLFQNAYPNTLDTTVAWKGFAANNSAEELTFIITGDINAMWLRDSANQLQSYKPLLARNSSTDSLASLYRGAINLQARYVLQFPHCNAFQPPVESGMGQTPNGWAASDAVRPKVDTAVVFECKYELDSIAAFLELSYDYYSATADAAFFGKFAWVSAIEMVLDTAQALLVGTYAADGSVVSAPYSFQRTASSATETEANGGAGSPVSGATGLVRSWFRPSDDATIYQLFVPANMMFSRYLAACADIMQPLNATLAQRMTDFAASIRAGIERYGTMNHTEFGTIYSYEVDGFGSHNNMDDANIPSLLSAPFLGYLERDNTVYQNTRRFVLSKSNPYYMYGPVINATGGPHVGPGNAWPMALIVQLLTSDDDDEITDGLRQLVSSATQLGLIHESIYTFSATTWTRQWFAWANGLFGQMILDLRDRKPHLLQTSFQ